jgi:DNA modification methylase
VLIQQWEVLQGDCLEILRGLSDNSVDAMVTDPPAGISFMGKEWDKDKGGRDQWIAWMSSVMAECLRVTKPGGHALVWALPRTSHWTATAIEDAGWEIRDVVTHLQGQGFPKGQDVFRLGIVPMVEQQLREQGVDGEIEWA